MTVADMSKTIDFYCSVLGTTAVAYDAPFVNFLMEWPDPGLFCF